jgi:hypothetical protein
MENWISTCRRRKLDPFLSPCTTLNSKWNKRLTVRSETLKLPEENTRKTLERISASNDFLTRTPTAQQLRERVDECPSQAKAFQHSKGNGHRLKKQTTEWEKICARIYRELKKLNS